MMSDEVFAIRKEGEEPSRGEIDIQESKCPCLAFHLRPHVTCPYPQNRSQLVIVS